MPLMDFSIDLILSAAIWPRGRPSLKQKLLPGIFLVVKGGMENVKKTCKLRAIVQGL
jgi:hypothetical protein